MCYNHSCLGEWKPGVLLLKAPSQNTIFYCGQSALHVWTHVRPVRLDNDGKHMEGVLLCSPKEKNQVNFNDQIEARVQEISDNELVAERYDEAGNLVCYYCGAPIGKHNTHRDHITPKSRGGFDIYWNIALACAECNLRKSISPPAFYLGLLPDDLQIDLLARIVLGSAVAQRRFLLSNSSENFQDSSLANVADKLSTLSDQLQQITKWMHMLEQEVVSLATTRNNQNND